MRIRERDLTIPTLRVAARSPGGCISTSDLIIELEKEFEPTGEDAEILEGRQDTRFSQIVRNLVSHRGSSTSIFSRGYATYHEESGTICITDAGRLFLNQVPE